MVSNQIWEYTLFTEYGIKLIFEIDYKTIKQKKRRQISVSFCICDN